MMRKKELEIGDTGEGGEEPSTHSQRGNSGYE